MTDSQYSQQEYYNTEFIPIDNYNIPKQQPRGLNIAQKQQNKISNHISILQKNLEFEQQQNANLAAETEKVEFMNSQLIMHRNQTIENLIERKIRFTLIKKEIDVKKSYLNSIIKRNKSKNENIDKEKSLKFEKSFDKINSTTLKLNEIVLKCNLTIPEGEDFSSLISLSIIPKNLINKLIKL